MHRWLYISFNDHILSYSGAVVIYIHLKVRCSKRCERIIHTYPERYMQHNLYPVFFLYGNHINKDKILLIA